MKKLLWLAVVLGSLLASCAVGVPKGANQPKGAALTSSGEPVEVTGTYSITNDFIFTYYVENMVALLDMHGFVIRDQEWDLPVKSQVLGYMTYDPHSKGGTFDLNLPALPQGEFNDVDNNGRQNAGVQIFAVGYSPNLSGGPFSEGDDRSRGWPTYLASVRTDTENKDEVTGGRLIVWAPDAQQSFPTGFGADGLLFTADDPVAPIPAGYTAVDLDKKPFEFLKAPKLEFTLYEPADAAIKDYSKLSYTEAFDRMFDTVRKEYAFNGVEGKQPDWDALYAELQPRVQKAEQEKDANGFYLALRDYTWAFKDGHVNLDGGEYASRDFSDATSGGYGFSIRELDDGRVLVVFVLAGGPAAGAGMKVGAQLTQFNGEPIQDAIAKSRSYALQSSDFALRYQQARYLLRAHPGDKAIVRFANPGETEQTVTLTAIAERDSFSRTSLYFGVNTDTLLPVEDQLLSRPNGTVGYIRINSNLDDLNLIVRLFERALQQFERRKVAGIVIDLRYNSGGANLGLAGSLTDQPIPLGQLEYYSETTKKFEPEGPRQKVEPHQIRYRFDKMVLLVGPACYSACETEAYGLGQAPGMVVVGQYPTAGSEAEVARGQFWMPEGFKLQVPTGRFALPDGSLFLEGRGVQPTLRVPVDETTVMSADDVVLEAGVQAALQPAGAGITPSRAPKIASAAEASDALSSGAKFLEDAAREHYDASQFAAPGRVTYTVPLGASETLIWSYVWCAADPAILEENLSKIRLKFQLDGREVATSGMSTYNVAANGKQCRLIYTALSEWPGGEHHLSTTATFTSPVNDGALDYAAGDYVLEYTVYVKP